MKFIRSYVKFFTDGYFVWIQYEVPQNSREA